MMLLLTFLVSAVVVANEVPLLSQQLSAITPAKPISRVNPQYPVNQAKRGNEGWVDISYVIDETGQVIEAIVERSSGINDFEKSALAAVTRWQFEPALEQGKPIVSSQNSVRLSFQMNDNQQGKVSRQFKKKFTQVKTALIKQDLATVQAVLNEIKEMPHYRLSEDVYYQLMLADFYAAKSDDYHEAQALVASHIWSWKFIDDKKKLPILQRLFALQANQGDLVNALKTYQSMTKLSGFKAIQAQYEGYQQRIKAMKSSNKSVVSQGIIEANQRWYLPLFRSNFTITDVKGKLTTLDIRCDNKHEQYTYADKNSWHIPQQWQHCSIYVDGENNTRFTLVQLPQNTTTTARIH
jgi:TonB family protein